MRWLMPLDGTWFYGDVLFILDPWIWLVLGGAAFLATSRGIVLNVAWVTVALAATFLVWSGLFGPIALKMLFIFGLTLVAFLRVRRLPRTEQGLQRLNRGALLVAGTYVVAMLVVAAGARRFTLTELQGRGLEVRSLMVAPLPITPLVREVLVETPRDYRFGTLSLWPRPALVMFDQTISHSKESPIVEQALEQPEIRGFSNWARFPWAEVIPEPNGVRIVLRDARYVRTRSDTGFGAAVVHLPSVADQSRQ
jgi:inner membrane protein